ncbi:BglG family transcription antiterminator [Staphylococcus sp. 18_1_E_LY]|uniref:BglG family transcription antiterminator n=1 Tax=Staphylococcus lloydii TaxID=2781774 RepID=A0A7T1FAC7_9STAP|nr:BglG family transcription antiterminator [Staphylococcus lloydii]MBF7020718.1 BglG family transcription antiterminator [Staphylococcus lloydii]MBF7028401.1 BglG family transcription antiterminator [Staphylococcus lloydii]QPM75878.1 BglG family transcription antiterminator [Staphylococcus lloydii]
MLLSTREKDIIDMLIKYYGQYVTIYDIAQNLAVSSRTIHRELKSVESSLQQFGLSLSRVTKKGIQLEGNKQQIDDLKNYLYQQTTVDLSHEEQKVIILYALIQSDEPIKQYSLAQEIGVSIQTLTKLLDELSQELENYQLTLLKKRGEGVHLKGTESKKRELLSQLMVNNLNSTSVYSVIENHFVYQSINQNQLSMVDMDKIFQVERILMDHLDRLPYSLTESSYLTLTVHIVLSIERMLKGEYVTLNDEIYNDVKKTHEHEIATALSHHLEHIYGVQFNQAEIGFITIHLRGAKRKDSEEIFKDDKDELKRIDYFINLVSQSTQMSFNNRETLSEGLKLHIIPAINRLNANIETYNPLTEMIKQDYPVLFETVSHSLRQVWPNFAFPDSEIGFIVLHFGGAIQRENEATFHALVVCSSGIGTSQILATRLQQTFSKITDTTQASVGDLTNINLNNYDAIISTVDLDITVPYITVNPLLPETDINHVSAFINVARPQKNISNLVQQPLPIDSNNQEDILNYMRKGLELIDSVYIDYTETKNWTKYLTKFLYEHKVIQSKMSFADLIHQRALEQNFVLEPYPLALPHLKHDMVLKPIILISILNEPINFMNDQNDQHEIQYLLCIFVPEDEISARIVSDFSSELVNHLDNLNNLMSQPEQLINILKQSYLQQLQTKLQNGVNTND